MRGQLDKTYPAPLRLRIIPARAGPTRPPSTSRSLKPDHPRSCGANFTPVETGSTPAGSSPLVRGQPELVLDPVERVRIIPARAGPTGRRSCRWSWRADHPRSCGANADQRMAVDDMNGSSPLVRGQPNHRQNTRWHYRIIPARAGPTWAATRRPRPSSDHPRSCGANDAALAVIGCVGGSSPLVRGQRSSRISPACVRRIIPARAGPTSSERHAPSTMTDHPRSCGANAVGLISAPFRGGSSPLVRGQPPAGLSAISPRGSSPLVRGQRWRHQYRSVHERIIPARAGPTSWLRWSRRVKPDHPRSCGANAHGLAPFVSRSGSSPLVRGQRSGMRLNRLTRRIIPARAGPTYSKRMTKTTATDHPRSCGANSFLTGGT